MKDILPSLKEWQARGDEIALATVLRVERAAPRLPGARLAATRGGRMAGSVSGGCVESDVFERAMQTLDTGMSAVVNYGIADELGFAVGLTCGGSIDVLIERFVPDREWLTLAGAIEGGLPAVYAVGLAPEPLLGRKLTMLPSVGSAGLPGFHNTGSIAPELDDLLAGVGRRLLQTGGTELAAFPWRGEEAQVFLEAFLPPPDLVIVGATHTAISLSRLGNEVGFQVTIVDARSVLATEERFPEPNRLIRAWPEEAMAQVPLGVHSAVVVLTHDPKFDLPALVCALQSPAGYIGALGGRVTHEARKRKLKEEGFTDADLARIRAPIGLDIGSRTPEELAVAILAEVLAVRSGKIGNYELGIAS